MAEKRHPTVGRAEDLFLVCRFELAAMRWSGLLVIVRLSLKAMRCSCVQECRAKDLRSCGPRGQMRSLNSHRARFFPRYGSFQAMLQLDTARTEVPQHSSGLKK
jgi:hypothetical protein